MSFYTKMFETVPQGFKGYLLLIGQHGEAAAYALGPDGRPESFAAGKVADVIGGAIKASLPSARLWDMGADRCWEGRRDRPFYWELGAPTWADVARVMNGRGKNAGRMLERYHMTNRLFDLEMIDWDDKQNKYVLTPKGLAADEKIAGGDD